MSRDKDEEKRAPMFPRLHVNNAEKAGPKAPPRNKMALYEQFSIPSQRFKSKILTPYSTHVSAHERNLPSHVSSSTHTHNAEMCNAGPSDGENGSTLFEHRKDLEYEADFTVPEFVQSGSEGWGRSSTMQSGRDKLMPEVMTKMEDENDQNQTDSVTGEEEIDAMLEEENESLSQTFQDKPTGNSSPDMRKRNRVLELAKDKKNTVHLQPINDTSSWKNINDSMEIANESGRSFVRKKGTQPLEDAAKSEAISETSTVDSVSGFGITPDNVVGIIGQKNFWKARRAILNQQKVFAVQLFELHRLIKVQQLIAGSPHLLVEDRAPQASSSLKACSSKILPSNFPKPQTHIADEPILKKIIHKFKPCSENPKPDDCGFHQPLWHQWLIPVMCPSEGLVYKPFSAPGVASTSSMMNPAYGIPCTPLVDHAHTPNYGMPFINPSPSDLAIKKRTSNDGAVGQGVTVVGSERQAGTASSLCENDWGGRKDVISKGREPRSLFPAPTAIEEPTQQVIRVVPHSRRHATKSAARIFRSIQQERKQND